MKDKFEKTFDSIEASLQAVVVSDGQHKVEVIEDARLILESTKQLKSSLLEMRQNGALFGASSAAVADFMSLFEENNQLFLEFSERHNLKILEG